MESAAGETTARVAHIITEVLGTDGAPLTENFYDLGGSSLQAIRICTRISRELALKAAPEDLFEHDTIGDFCTALIRAQSRE
ncbi:phosphopantetheine-binding protein [Streptomyces monticola]|uniref:Phosphopantetheine-binding protein n=1 Tax=Streptomyces monticola TaxID=2666263 RepID=A0ABW2JW09_9ACTN